MTQQAWIGSGGRSTAFGTGLTFYPALGGPIFQTATEAHAQYNWRETSTLRHLHLYIQANSYASGNMTVGSRIGGLDGNLQVSIAAAATGAFSDTTHTDALTATSQVNWKVTTPAAASGTCTISSIAAASETSGQASVNLVATQLTAGVTQGAGVTRWSGFGGQVNVVANDQARATLAVESATISNLQYRTAANTVNGTATVTSRKNGVAGNQTLSIGASTTGLFEDTTHSDTVVAGDLFYAQTVTAGTSGTIDCVLLGVRYVSGTSEAGLLPLSGTVTTGTVLFGGPFSQLGLSVTEAWAFGSTPVSGTLDRLYTSIFANTRDGSSTIISRINFANGNLSVSVGASTTGGFSDTTHSDTGITRATVIDFKVTPGGTTGSLTYAGVSARFTHAGVTATVNAAGSSSPVASIGRSITKRLLALALITVSSANRRSTILCTPPGIVVAAALGRTRSLQTTIAASPVAGLARTMAKQALVAVTSQASIREALGKYLLKAVTVSSSVVRTRGMALLNAATVQALLKRTRTLLALVSTSPLSGISRVRVLAAASAATVVALVQRALARTHSATTAPAATTNRTLTKRLLALVLITVSSANRRNNLLLTPVGIVVQANVSRGRSMAVAATSSVVAAAGHVLTKLASAAAEGQASLRESTTRSYAKAVTITATLVRSRTLALSRAVTVLGSILRQRAMTLRSAVTVATSLARTRTMQVSALASAVATRSVNTLKLRRTRAATVTTLTSFRFKQLTADVSALAAAGKTRLLELLALSGTSTVALLQRYTLLARNTAHGEYEVRWAMGQPEWRTQHAEHEQRLTLAPLEDRVQHALYTGDPAMVQPRTWPSKTPAEIKLYGFDWSPRRLDDDAILSVSATVESGDCVVESSSIGRVQGSKSLQGTKHLISGGTDGTTCTILLEVTTATNPVLQQRVTLDIVDE